jgi:hypothetical protein
VFIMFAYVASCVSLVLLSRAFPPNYRLLARALGVCGAVFCVAIVVESEADLLIWVAAAVLLAFGAYGAVRLRRRPFLKSAIGV